MLVNVLYRDTKHFVKINSGQMYMPFFKNAIGEIPYFLFFLIEVIFIE